MKTPMNIIENEFNRIEKAYLEHSISEDDAYALCHLFSEDSCFLESFVGKTENLLECEKILDMMKGVVARNPSVDLTNHQLNRKLEKLLKAEFGFNSMHITWFRTSPLRVFNAYHARDLNEPNKLKQAAGIADEVLYRAGRTDSFSIPCVNIFFKNIKDSNNQSKIRKGQRYYDNTHSMVVSVGWSMGTFYDTDYTGGEILAMTLHEIGHNFDGGLYMFSQHIMNMTENFIGNMGLTQENFKRVITQNGREALKTLGEDVVIYLGTKTTPIRKICDFMDNTLAKLADKIPGVKILFDALVKARYIVDEAKEVVNLFNINVWKDRIEAGKEYWDYLKELARVLTIDIKNLSGLFILQTANSIATKKTEIFADSFASTYGYGPELASALNKNDIRGLKHIKKLPKNFIIGRVVMDINNTAYMLLNTLADQSHGSNVERAYKILQIQKTNLRKEKDLPPEIRQELEDQINQLQEFVDSYPGRTADDGMYISAALQWFIIHVFKGNTFLVERIFPDKRA